MTDDTILPFSFPAVQAKKVTAAFDGGRLTSNGGVMLLAMPSGVSVDFRSSFRDWASNVSNFPREVVETAHVIGDKAEQAYRRSDALEKRRKLMEPWAHYCEPKTSGNVVQIRGR